MAALSYFAMLAALGAVGTAARFALARFIPSTDDPSPTTTELDTTP